MDSTFIVVVTEISFISSSVIRKLLIAAATASIQFRVIVVDSRPLLEGRAMLQAVCKRFFDRPFIN